MARFFTCVDCNKRAIAKDGYTLTRRCVRCIKLLLGVAGVLGWENMPNLGNVDAV